MTDKLNPKRKEFEIGKREIRTIEILPVSIADQFKLSDLINEGIQAFTKLQESSDDKAFIAKILDIVRKNLDRILELVVEDKPSDSKSLKFWKKRTILDDITNEQAFEIAQIIYEMNYAVLLKKVKDLLENHPGIKGLLSGRSLPPFSEDILSSGSKTSTKKASGKGA